MRTDNLVDFMRLEAQDNASAEDWLSQQIALKKGEAGTGAACAATLSLPGINAGVFRAIG